MPTSCIEAQKIITDLQKSEPEKETTKIRYPGEHVVKIRKENLQNGIPVNSVIWDQILMLESVFVLGYPGDILAE